MIEIQDIFVRFGADFLKSHTLSPVQAKAFRAIQNCRTSALGAHVDTCDECGFEKISYNSCRNRHCPKCQSLTKEQWIEKQNQYLLNTGYFHVVFTLPEKLNAVMLRNQEKAYGLFFKAVSETLLELCADKKYLGAVPGITTVLHTWGQNLTYHPHIHCIVTGGGLTADGKWQSFPQLHLNGYEKFSAWISTFALVVVSDIYRELHRVGQLHNPFNCLFVGEGEAMPSMLPLYHHCRGLSRFFSESISFCDFASRQKVYYPHSKASRMTSAV